MEKIQFICELLTDVVLNTKAVSGSDNQTLDFIPGNCFLGIVARQLYKSEDSTTALLFHSGAVRFGDAHPLCDGIRTLRIPALYFHPKLEKVPFYLYHKVDDGDAELRKKQLKQCRDGFYAFNDAEKSIAEFKFGKNYSIKSAYNSEKLCSERGGMYGYESLQRGASLAFEIELDDCALDKKELLKNTLCGTHSVGHSRTAQYGRIKITLGKWHEPASAHVQNSKEWFVYADGRLIFLDKYGIPIFRPTAKDLGIDNGTIIWEKSQIRTFQYAPWNAKRQAFDNDRCGIEKGSVLCVECKGDVLLPESKYIGYYRNEGFGRVLYNPSFLQSDSAEVSYSLKKHKEKDDKERGTTSQNSSLLKYLNRQEEKQKNASAVYRLVNNFVDKNGKLYSGEAFASQWGQIRNIAMQAKSYNDIEKQLFEEGTGYLSHGVCADKWRGNRSNALRDFLMGNDKIAKELLIKLASEMQKK